MLVNDMIMYSFAVTVKNIKHSKRMVSDLKVELPNIFATGIIDGYRGDLMTNSRCSHVYLQSDYVFDNTDCTC